MLISIGNVLQWKYWISIYNIKKGLSIEAGYGGSVRRGFSGKRFWRVKGTIIGL
jgi:hypothetical protein